MIDTTSNKNLIIRKKTKSVDQFSRWNRIKIKTTRQENATHATKTVHNT